MFPAGLVIMFTEFGRQFLWTTSAFLGLQAFILLIVLFKSAGALKSVFLSLVILSVSYGIELIGLNTGFPFGSYAYTDVLKPVIFGVPLAITFAWLSVALSSYMISVLIFPPGSAAGTCFIASAIILAVDILLEPFASFINGFWIWEAGEIPIQNFISWFAAGFVFCILISVFFPADKVRSLEPGEKRTPFIVIGLNILIFTVLNIYHGYLLISIIALVIILWVIILIPLIVKREF